MSKVKPRDQEKSARDAVRAVVMRGGLSSNPAEGIYAAAHTAWMEGYYSGLIEAQSCASSLDIAELAKEAAETLVSERTR